MPPSDPSVVVDALGGTLSCERFLVLGWQPLEAPPLPAQLEYWHDEGLRVFGAVALLDENRRGAAAGDELRGVEAEIAGLHQKLNLVIDLLSMLVSRQTPAGSEVPVRLSAQGLAWRGAAETGQLGLVSLGLHRSVPQAWQWPARVVARVEGEIQARFEPMREPLAEALERYVFLHHRRAIAGHRRSA